MITVVEVAFIRYGKDKHPRSDNGPEFIAYAIQDRLAAAQIKTLYIKPGSSWENGHIKSFHDKLRGGGTLEPRTRRQLTRSPRAYAPK